MKTEPRSRRDAIPYHGSMDTLVDRLGSAGVRLTAQRRVIAQCLEGQNQHLTADEVLARAKAVLPEIGRATVYKALAEFVGAGAVREVQFGEGVKRFDPNAHRSHHHLVCTGCDGIWDVEVPDPINPAIGDGSDPSSFLVDHAEVSFFGQCPDCR